MCVQVFKYQPKWLFENLGAILCLLLWLKLEISNTSGFSIVFQNCHWTRQTRPLICWLAKCFLKFCSLGSISDFTSERVCGDSFNFATPSTAQSTAAIQKHFQWNWGRRPTLSFSSGWPQATWLRPWGLLCTSQIRSEAAKERENVKDNKLKILFQTSPLSAAGISLKKKQYRGEGRIKAEDLIEENKAERRWASL